MDMNKFKVFTILLSCLMMTGVMFSCESEETNGNGEYGSVLLSVQTDPSFVMTKADPENVNEYNIEILQGENIIDTYSYSELPEKLELEPGEYTAKASWGTLSAAAFESLYMEGSKTFTITKGKATQVSLECKPANAKVTVDYSAEVQKAYSDYKVSMSTSHTPETPLIFGKDEVRAGYFKVDEKGEKLNLAMSFFDGGKEYPFKQSTTIKPRDFVRFHVKMDPNNILPTLSVKPEFYHFTSEGGFRDFMVNTNQSEWEVSYKANWLEVLEWDTFVTIHVYPNNTEEARSTTIAFKTGSGDKSATASVFISQDPNSGTPGNAQITVTPTNIVAKPHGETGVEAVVTCKNEEWTIINDASWIKALKEENKVVFDFEANETKSLRTASVLLKTQKNGKESTATIFVFQEATSAVEPETSPLTVTVYINEEFIKEETLKYELEVDESETPPSVSGVGFEHAKLLTVKAGQAPAGLRVNIRAMGKIKNCIWDDTLGGSLDLAKGSNSGLESAGLLWDAGMKEQTLSTIYLDKFINKLSPGNYSYNVKVTDKSDRYESITLTISITN